MKKFLVKDWKSLASHSNSNAWYEAGATVIPKTVNSISKLVLSISWKDQGPGLARKGGCKVVILRGSKVITEIQPFGVAKHTWQIKFWRAPPFFMNNFKAGDKLALFFRVGKGQKHKLFVASVHLNLIGSLKPNAPATFGSGWSQTYHEGAWSSTH